MAEGVDGTYSSSDQCSGSLRGSKMSDSLGMAHDFYYDPYCEVCAGSKNQNIKHEGFCDDCDQFLCSDCLRVHRKLEAARGHVILKGDDMPKSMADKPPKFKICNTHQHNRKDQFCCMHRVLLCSLCVTTQHKNCPVQSVGDACKGLSSSTTDTVYDKVKTFRSNLSTIATQLNTNITELGVQKGDIVKDAREIKASVLAKIEKLFDEIISGTDTSYETQSSNLHRSKHKLDNVIETLDETLDQISKIKGSNVDVKVFLKIQDILQDVEQCRLQVEHLKPSVGDVKMSFVKNKWIEDFLSTTFKMGSISCVVSSPLEAISAPNISFPVSPARPKSATKRRGNRTPSNTTDQADKKIAPLPRLKAHKLASYDVMLSSDTTGCCIHGLAITYDGRQLLADCDNSNIKLFSKDMKSHCSSSLSSAPWNIAVTRGREAVVSYRQSKLLVLDIFDKNMRIKGNVRVPFAVVGIAPYKEKLIVTSASTSPRAVKLIDQGGTVFWSTAHGKQGERLFISPDYVICYDDGGSADVIVSDQSNNTLTVLNADTGDVKARRDVNGKSPKGVTTDPHGNIYVCYYSADEIAVLSRDLSQQIIILSIQDGLKRGPQAISYNAVDHQLLVSYTSDKVDCFTL